MKIVTYVTFAMPVQP